MHNTMHTRDTQPSRTDGSKQPSPNHTHGTHGRGWRRWVPACLLVVVCLGVWSSSLGGEFNLDDEAHIVDPRKTIESQNFLESMTGNRPMVSASIWLNFHVDRALGGDGLRTAGYHVWNITVHTLAALVLWLLVRDTLLIDRRPDREAMTRTRAGWFAFAVALLWSIHPLQTESVAYIIQRGEAMVGLFMLTAVWGLNRVAHVQAGGWDASGGSPGRWRAWAWGGCVVMAALLGAGSKEVMVVTPVVMLMYDRVFVARGWRELVARRWAVHLAVWVIVLPMVLSHLPGVGGMLRGDGAVPHPAGVGVLETEHPAETPASAGFGMEGLDPYHYAISQPGVILHYLRLSVWPRGQCFDYGWPVAKNLREVAWPIGAMMLMLIATGITKWRWPRVGFCAATFFFILAPTSSVMPIADLCVEHRMYLPLAPVCVLVVMGVWMLLGRIKVPAARVGVSCVLLVGVSVPLAWATVQRNALYHDPLALWQDAVSVSPNNWRGHYSVGIYLARGGNFREAADAFAESLKFKPGDVKTRTDYARAIALLGYTDEAIRQLRIALDTGRGDAQGWYELGVLLLQKNDLPAARDAFIHCTNLPTGNVNPEAHNLLGITLAKMGDIRGAVEHFTRAVQLDPGNPNYRENLSRATEQRTPPATR